MAEISLPASKRCSKCKVIKPAEAFLRRKYAPHLLVSRCRPCNIASSKQHYADARKAALASRGWMRWPNVPQEDFVRIVVYRRTHMLRVYGLAVDEYFDMFSKQNGRCAICEESGDDKGLAVDHCHATGKIRGLLCTKCNAAMGGFKDCAHRLRRAIQYLKSND